MTATLKLTTLGEAAIADGANVGLAALGFTKLALGSGTAAGDQSGRQRLITQRDIVSVTGSAATPSRVAIRGDFDPTVSYAVTEVGLFATAGDPAGPEFLCAYWVAPNAAGAVAAASHNAPLVVAGVVEITNSAADLTITPALNIAIGVPADVVRTTDQATTDKFGVTRLASDVEVQALASDTRVVTPGGLGTVLSGYSDTTVIQTWVKAQIAAVVGTAGAALDTLGEIATELGKKLSKTGGTMTGALNLVTPGASDDSKKAVNSEWVLARFAERPMIKQKYLYTNDSTDGLEIVSADTGTLVQLTENLSGYRFLEFLGYKLGTGEGEDKRVWRGVAPIAIADIPAARGVSGPRLRILTADVTENYDSHGITEIWRPSGTTLRLETQGAGAYKYYLRAVIGWGAS